MTPLGLRVAGESENWGIEQERLNNVFGARLRITTLRAAAGPGVELLEYLAPADGRPIPEGVRANDLVYWQTRVVCPDAEAALRSLRAARAALVSPGAVDVRGTELGFDRGITACDPDRHVVQISVREPAALTR